MANLSYRLSDPASARGLLYEAIANLLLVGVVGYLIAFGGVTIRSVSAAAAAATVVCGAVGFILYPAILANERARRLWSHFGLRAMVIGVIIIGMSEAINRGLIDDAVVLLAAVGLLCGSIAGRAGIYVRARGD